MTTSSSGLRESSRQASAVSSTHFFTCRANFILNVAPNFPAAKVFAQHFEDSYVLMKSLSAESKEPVPAGFGLLLLGVKGHETLPASFTTLLLRSMDLLTHMSLAASVNVSGKWEVFNPLLIRPQLEYMLGKDMPTDLRECLKIFAEHNAYKPSLYRYELLGWPTLVSPSDLFSTYTINTGCGRLHVPSKADKLLSTGQLVSKAAAVVAQMMEPPDAPPKLILYSEALTAAA